MTKPFKARLLKKVTGTREEQGAAKKEIPTGRILHYYQGTKNPAIEQTQTHTYNKFPIKNPTPTRFKIAHGPYPFSIAAGEKEKQKKAKLCWRGYRV
jgi:hypothetical protein